MTRYGAWAKARELWATGLTYAHGVARQRHKNVADRCEVGYWHDGETHIKGRGPTWEAAFKNAGVEL